MTFATSKNFSVLLTDDDDDDREIFQETIEELDTETSVTTLDNGETLMDYLSNPENPLPDILFLDINMPHKDGYACLVEIRKDTRLKNLCVIIYSTSGYTTDVRKAYELGANGFIQKPSNHSDLKNILEKVLDTDWKDPCSALDEHRFILQP